MVSTNIRKLKYDLRENNSGRERPTMLKAENALTLELKDKMRDIM